MAFGRDSGGAAGVVGDEQAAVENIDTAASPHGLILTPCGCRPGGNPPVFAAVAVVVPVALPVAVAVAVEALSPPPDGSRFI